MAAVEAIRHVLETDGPEEDEIQQRYRLTELQYIPNGCFSHPFVFLRTRSGNGWTVTFVTRGHVGNVLKVTVFQIRMLRTILVLELNGWTFMQSHLGNLKTTLICAVHVEISMQTLFFASGRGDLKVVCKL